MRSIALILAAVLSLFAGPVLAQETVQPTERARELAARYIELLNIEEMMQGQMAGMTDMTEDWSTALGVGTDTKGPRGPSAQMETFTPDTAMEGMGQYLEMIEGVMIEASARTYTEAELEALVAFYESDLGRSVAGKQDDFSLAMMAVMLERLPEMMESLGLGGILEDEDPLIPGDSWTDPTHPLLRLMTPAS